MLFHCVPSEWIKVLHNSNIQMPKPRHCVSSYMHTFFLFCFDSARFYIYDQLITCNLIQQQGGTLQRSSLVKNVPFLKEQLCLFMAV